MGALDEIGPNGEVVRTLHNGENEYFVEDKDVYDLRAQTRRYS